MLDVLHVYHNVVTYHSKKRNVVMTRLCYFSCINEQLKCMEMPLRWHGRLSAKVNKIVNLGYSHDRGFS